MIFREIFLKVYIPTLGPLEEEEELLTDKYVEEPRRSDRGRVAYFEGVVAY